MEWILAALLLIGGFIYVAKSESVKNKKVDVLSSSNENNTSKEEKLKDFLIDMYHSSITKLITNETEFVKKGEIHNTNYALYMKSNVSLDKSFKVYIRNHLEVLEKMWLFEGVEKLSSEYGLPIYKVKEIIKETTMYVLDIYCSQI